jgi:hypothetical protein
MFKSEKIGFSKPRLILVLLMLIPVLFNEIDNHKTQVLYDGFFYGPLYELILIIFLIIIIFDLLLFLEVKKIKSFIPSLIGLFFISVILSIMYFHNYKIHQKTIYKAKLDNSKYFDNQINYEIEFKEKGNYVVFETEEEGFITNFYYGKYIKKDSIFILDNVVGKKKISNRLLIKLIKNNINKKNEKQLVQIDENGKLLENKFMFKLVLK